MYSPTDEQASRSGMYSLLESSRLLTMQTCQLAASGWAAPGCQDFLQDSVLPDLQVITREPFSAADNDSPLPLSIQRRNVSRWVMTTVSPLDKVNQ